MLDQCVGNLPTYYFFFFILAKLEGITLKHYVIFCDIYFSRCHMYLYSGLVTFTQPPIYLFSPFHCRQSCLTGLSGEYNLPLSNAFQGFSPFFSSSPPPCHECTWNVTLFLKLMNFSSLYVKCFHSVNILTRWTLFSCLHSHWWTKVQRNCKCSSGYFSRAFLWIFICSTRFKLDY